MNLALQWICLSDLHFGAANSLLTNLDAATLRSDPSVPSPVLTDLVACVRDVVERTGGTRPTLILNGDILEFALASDEIAARAFDRFIDLAFDPAEPVFDDTIYYLPGNHDHHMWETAREQQYSQYVASVPPTSALQAPWHVTRMFEKARGGDAVAQPGDGFPLADLLTTLVQRRHPSGNVTVRLAYPNLGFHTPDESTIVFHHGHFVESIYSLMTNLRLALFPGDTRGTKVWEWEGENWAWIDFFFSTMGRSGQAGDDVGEIYAMAQDPVATKWLADNLVPSIRSRVPGPKLVGSAVAPAIRYALHRVASRVASLEREASGTLSPDAESGLAAYLNGPLTEQFRDEHPAGTERPMTFVFGHTHKPFERRRRVDRFSRPVDQYNTGGWVVDSERTTTEHGAALVMGDSDGNVASLHMYNESDRRADYRVELAPPLSDEPNALWSRLDESLDLGAPPWSTFSATVATSVDARHLALRDIIARAMKPPTPLPSTR